MHISVLLNECIENLNIKEDGCYVDATLGYAGHSSEILKRINKGYLFAFDQDKEAINYSNEKLKAISDNYKIIYSNFENIKSKLNEEGITKVDGILFDIGVSSPQLDNDFRGFSYHKDARLDMRMDTESNFSAYELVNEYSESELTTCFYKYAESKYAKSIARNIVKYREVKPIETTLELSEIIKESVPYKERRKSHPAKVIFQAIRIEVNRELEVFEKALEDGLELLAVNGRMCVITFHSLEDRICKHMFKEVSSVSPDFKNLPSIPEEYEPKFKLISKKGIKASEIELETNNRSRSAVLRVIERVKE